MRFFLFAFFLLSAFAQLSADATVFVYHRFNDIKHPSTSISNAKLRKDFRYLKENGYRVVKLSELVSLLKSGQPIPQKTVALTIDDGYRSFYDNGLPIFREFGYPFTLYVYVKATEKGYGDYMSWEEIKASAKYGEIGLHSFDHPHLPYLSDVKIKHDTQKAADIFQKRLEFAAKSYAYPYGEFDERVKKLIMDEGFEFVCNQNAGAVAPFSDPYDIERIAVTEDTNIKTKLRTEALHVKNIDLITTDNRVTRVTATLVDPSVRNVEIYVSGYGWERVKVNNAKVSYNTDKRLKLDRSRVIIKSGRKIASKLIMKRKHNGQ